jgi:SAM-dependent methyltransferase
MVDRSCPVCGSRDERQVFAEAKFDAARLDRFAFASRKVPEHMHHRLIACPTCDTLYSSPVPDLESLADAYREAAFDSSDEAGYAARTYGRLIDALGARVPRDAGALDIGTGDGAFLAELLARGFTGVVGVEPSAAPIRAAPEAIRPLIRQGLFDPGQFEAASLGLVTCFQTLEHLADPLAICRGAGRLLRKGGAFMAVCHDRRSLSARLLGMKSPIFDIEHLQLFSPRSARTLLERAGFAEVEVRRIVNVYPVHYWLKLLPMPERLKARFLTAGKGSGWGNLPLPLPAGNMAVIGYQR